MLVPPLVILYRKKKKRIGECIKRSTSFASLKKITVNIY